MRSSGRPLHTPTTPPGEDVLRRRSWVMPEQHVDRSHLTSTLTDTCASGSSLSTPSNLAPPLSKFLYTHTSPHPQFSPLHLSQSAPCQAQDTSALLLAGPGREASFRHLSLGCQPSRTPDLPSSRVSRGPFLTMALPCTGIHLRRAV